jgi:hypothetical protein
VESLHRRRRFHSIPLHSIPFHRQSQRVLLTVLGEKIVHFVEPLALAQFNLHAPHHRRKRNRCCTTNSTCQHQRHILRFHLPPSRHCTNDTHLFQALDAAIESKIGAQQPTPLPLGLLGGEELGCALVGPVARWLRRHRENTGVKVQRVGGLTTAHLWWWWWWWRWSW